MSNTLTSLLWFKNHLTFFLISENTTHRQQGQPHQG